LLCVQQQQKQEKEPTVGPNSSHPEYCYQQISVQTLLTKSLSR
jgi:hypothetical protein